MELFRMWAASTVLPTVVSVPHCKASPLKYGIWFGETNWLSFNRLPFRLTIRVAGSKDFFNAPQIKDEDHITGEALKAIATKKKRDYIAYIRWMLSTLDDGRISISPYDTAWIALIENINGNGTPKFPSSLEWIAQNQLPDGSWGDADQFSVHDRLLNTLACVIALRYWNYHQDKSEKGIKFVEENLPKLENAYLESMTCGFEIIFPPLLERARNLGVEIPCSAPVLEKIFDLRALKFARIPKDLMHEVPTSILYSFEGIEELDWEKLLKLKTEEGSFLTSPSATAFAFMQTKDKNCLEYINDIITKFNGGAPTVYPIDLFARLWAVDRLQRLGISRLFGEEIMECLNYVYRFWTSNGIFSGRCARVYDLDDTSMAFRLLRLQGFDVTPDIFKHFKSDDKFYCLGGELNKSPTTILNLYRASQVQFPDEKILEEAKNFSYNFLKYRVSNNESTDKWIISKDIPGELRYGLDIPWFASLPRIEARFYVEQYSGANDVWVGKTLYRVAEISNNVYLELAKLDYNECQVQHQLEWINMQKWWAKCNLKRYGISRENLLLAYFIAAASIFEPGRSTERFAWAKCWIMIQLVSIYFEGVATSREQRSAFLAVYKGNTAGFINQIDEMGKVVLSHVDEFIRQLSSDTFEMLQRDTYPLLNSAWEKWLTTSMDTQFRKSQNEAAFLVQIINLCGGNVAVSNEILSRDDQYICLSNLINQVCRQLREYEKYKKVSLSESPQRNTGGINFMEIETGMQELVQLVLQIKPSDIITQAAKQTFLIVANAFYYMAFCGKETVNSHMSKVLFKRVV